jgi:hypothetical protein
VSDIGAMGELLELVKGRDPDDWVALVRRLQATGEATGSPDKGPSVLFERARDVLAQREREHHADHTLTAALLDGIRAERARPAPTPPQISVDLVAGDDGLARGRFVLQNGTGSRQTLTFRPSEQRGRDWAGWLPLRFDPPVLELAPGTEGTVALIVDVRAAPVSEMELDVEVHHRGALSAIVWVSVHRRGPT